MENNNQSLWLKVHNIFKNKVNPTIKKWVSWLASGVASQLRKSQMMHDNINKTLQDIPAILKTEAVTWGPKTLDAINDYVAKPIARNASWLITGKDPLSNRNKLDDIADTARAYEKDFYKTHNFKQQANRKYWETLGNVLAGGIETLATTPMAAPKTVAVANKVKPWIANLAKNASTKIDDLSTKINNIPTKVKSTIGNNLLTKEQQHAKNIVDIAIDYSNKWWNPNKYYNIENIITEYNKKYWTNITPEIYDKVLLQRIKNTGWDIEGISPEYFTSFWKQILNKWQDIIDNSPVLQGIITKTKSAWDTISQGVNKIKNIQTQNKINKVVNWTAKAVDDAVVKINKEVLQEVTSPTVIKEITKEMSSKVKTIDAQLKALDKIMKATKWTASPEQVSKMKLAKERLLQDKEIYSNYSWFTAFYKKLQQARANKQMDKLLKEEGPWMAWWKKIMIGLGWTSIGWLLAAKYLGWDDNKSEWYEDNKVDIPEDFEIDMREIQNALWESLSDSGSTEGINQIDNFATTPQNNFPVNVTGSQNWGIWNSVKANTSQNNASVSVWELYNQNWERVTLFRNGDKLQVRSPNGQVITLATGVTDFNQGRKYTEIANTVLPF